jgi:hypothetical protein
MTKPQLEHFIQEAISNIRDDRALTSTLLVELMKHMKTQGEHTHETLGLIASKYVETLQRSNEQLVKLSSIIQKKENTVFAGLTNEDKDSIFDLINEEEKIKSDEGK